MHNRTASRNIQNDSSPPAANRICFGKVPKIIPPYLHFHAVKGNKSGEISTVSISPSPFRKLQIAESEYGLQNFTESGYGFRIYGIEVDMYRISRGIIFRVFFWKSQIRHLRIPRIHGFRTDCAALPKTELRPPTNSHPAPGPARAGGACCGRTRFVCVGRNLCKKKTLNPCNEN